jgi:hypothetical protein
VNLKIDDVRTDELIAKMENCKLNIYNIDDALTLFGANGVKKGRVEEKASEMQPTKWLTGQKNILNDLKANNIQLINYPEDKIPKELITKIIINK